MAAPTVPPQIVSRRRALLEFLLALECHPTPYHLQAHHCLGECAEGVDCPCCSETCACPPVDEIWWADRLAEAHPGVKRNGNDYRQRQKPRGELGRVILSTDPTVRAELMRKRFLAGVGLFDGGLKVTTAFAFAVVGLGNERNGYKVKVINRDRKARLA